MKVYYLLASAFCVWIKPTQSQFFYSHYTQLPTTHFAPVFPQTIFPTIARVPSFPVIPPLTYSLPHDHDTQGKTATTTTSTVTYNIPSVQNSGYLGFGYRTELKDGASSTVFYVTGPESENLRNFKDFPNFSRQVQQTEGKARSLASDITDINAVPDAQGKIQSILQPTEFQRLFTSPLPGVINFYSYPAGTVPLPRQLLNDTGLSTTTTATTSTNSSASEETVADESVINTTVLKNNIENEEKSNSKTEKNTTTTTTSTTTIIATTEVLENKTEDTATENGTTQQSAVTSEEGKEVTTTDSNNNETSTLETTTQV